MPRKRKAGKVAFIVELEDGSTHRVIVDEFTLRSGDHIVRVIASEQQEGGQMRKAKIVSVRRAPPSEQPT